MATERSPEATAHFRAELARIERRMRATLEGQHSARRCLLLSMRTLYPELPAAFWAAMSRLTHDDLRAVSKVLDTQFEAGVLRGMAVNAGKGDVCGSKN